jgi:hypothetical protein
VAVWHHCTSEAPKALLPAGMRLAPLNQAKESQLLFLADSVEAAGVAGIF